VKTGIVMVTVEPALENKALSFLSLYFYLFVVLGNQTMVGKCYSTELAFCPPAFKY
jgi:hypothetical protein